MKNLAEFAVKHDIWIIADNAYENYDYSTEGYIDIAEFDVASERTFAVYTFSKTFAMPGHRIGYVVSPELMGERVQKMSLYSLYSISTVSQFRALEALKTEPEILEKYRLLSKESRDIVTNELTVPFAYPQGGLYVFLDLSKWKNGIDDFILRCIDNGVSLAPGIAFGKAFKNYARLCFTAVNHDDLHLSIQRINSIYQSGTEVSV